MIFKRVWNFFLIEIETILLIFVKPLFKSKTMEKVAVLFYILKIVSNSYIFYLFNSLLPPLSFISFNENTKCRRS